MIWGAHEIEFVAGADDGEGDGGYGYFVCSGQLRHGRGRVQGKLRLVGALALPLFRGGRTGFVIENDTGFAAVVSGDLVDAIDADFEREITDGDGHFAFELDDAKRGALGFLAQPAIEQRLEAGPLDFEVRLGPAIVRLAVFAEGEVD